MNTDQRERYGAATGIIFVVLLIVAFVTTPEPPNIDSSAQELAKYYVDESGGIQVSNVFGIFAFLFFIWFLGTIRSVLSTAELATGRLSSIAFGSGLVGTVGVFVAITFTAAAAFNPEQTSPDVLRALHIVNYGMSIAVTGSAFAMFFAAVALVTLRTGVLPAALGWIAALAAVLWIPVVAATWTDSGAFSADGVFAYLGALALSLWALVTSIVLVRRPVALAATEETMPG
jgi:hypothetical protein